MRGSLAASRGGHQTFMGELQTRQAVLASRRNPGENDPAFRALRAALDHLHAKVPAHEAPELFISMAKGAEVVRAEETFLGRRPADKNHPLDPAAVSVVVIKALNSLRYPLLSAADCSALLQEAFRDTTTEVKVLMVQDMVQKMVKNVPGQAAALHSLLRYLARLDRHCPLVCPASRVAPALGPPLLRPERCSFPEAPGELTNNAIWAVDFLIRHYEEVFDERLPDEVSLHQKQQEVTDRLLRLITKNPPPLPPGALGKKGGGPPPPPPPPPPGALGKKKENQPANGPQPSMALQHSPGKERELQLQGQGLDAEEASAAQRCRLKQLHWDKLKQAREGTVWTKGRPGQLHINYAELESLFQILENNTLKKLGGAKTQEVRLVEHRRAHNICIELSGIRKPFAEIKDALLRMDASALTVEQLSALARAVPDDTERKELQLYLAGQHPKYKSMADVERLGTVERYFVEIKDIPRLGERIKCFIFTRTYAATKAKCEEHLELMRAACGELRDCAPFSKVLQAVLELGNHLNQGTHRGAAAGFRLDTLLKLADVKGTDRKTSLLHFVAQQLVGEDPALREMSTALAHVRPAANMQLSAIKTMIGEVRLGLRGVHNEVVAAARTRDAEGSGSRHFSEMMAAFHATACEEFRQMEEREAAMLEDLRGLADYFGEEFVPADPTRILRTVRDFVGLFDKALADLRAREDAAARQAEEARKREAIAAAIRAKRAAAPHEDALHLLALRQAGTNAGAEAKEGEEAAAVAEAKMGAEAGPGTASSGEASGAATADAVADSNAAAAAAAGSSAGSDAGSIDVQQRRQQDAAQQQGGAPAGEQEQGSAAGEPAPAAELAAEAKAEPGAVAAQVGSTSAGAQGQQQPPDPAASQAAEPAEAATASEAPAGAASAGQQPAATEAAATEASAGSVYSSAPDAADEAATSEEEQADGGWQKARLPDPEHAAAAESPAKPSSPCQHGGAGDADGHEAGGAAAAAAAEARPAPEAEPAGRLPQRQSELQVDMGELSAEASFAAEEQQAAAPPAATPPGLLAAVMRIADDVAGFLAGTDSAATPAEARAPGSSSASSSSGGQSGGSAAEGGSALASESLEQLAASPLPPLGEGEAGAPGDENGRDAVEVLERELESWPIEYAGWADDDSESVGSSSQDASRGASPSASSS